MNYPMSIFEAGIKHEVINAEFARQICEAFSRPVVQDIPSVSAISSLFRPSRPSHISRFVVTVIVDSVDAVIDGWSRPYIGDELLKGMHPRITDSNAAATIPGVCPASRIHASLFDSKPNGIFAVTNTGAPVSSPSAARCLASKAATRACLAETKKVKFNRENISTITETSNVSVLARA